ncbi:hypothetical protein WDU94_002983 [Cyamophila willieti]
MEVDASLNSSTTSDVDDEESDSQEKYDEDMEIDNSADNVANNTNNLLERSITKHRKYLIEEDNMYQVNSNVAMSKENQYSNNFVDSTTGPLPNYNEESINKGNNTMVMEDITQEETYKPNPQKASSSSPSISEENPPLEDQLHQNLDGLHQSEETSTVGNQLQVVVPETCTKDAVVPSSKTRSCEEELESSGDFLTSNVNSIPPSVHSNTTLTFPKSCDDNSSSSSFSSLVEEPPNISEISNSGSKSKSPLLRIENSSEDSKKELNLKSSFYNNIGKPIDESENNAPVNNQYFESCFNNIDNSKPSVRNHYEKVQDVSELKCSSQNESQPNQCSSIESTSITPTNDVKEIEGKTSLDNTETDHSSNNCVDAHDKSTLNKNQDSQELRTVVEESIDIPEKSLDKSPRNEQCNKVTESDKCDKLVDYDDGSEDDFDNDSTDTEQNETNLRICDDMMHNDEDSGESNSKTQLYKVNSETNEDPVNEINEKDSNTLKICDDRIQSSEENGGTNSETQLSNDINSESSKDSVNETNTISTKEDVYSTNSQENTDECQTKSNNKEAHETVNELEDLTPIILSDKEQLNNDENMEKREEKYNELSENSNSSCSEDESISLAKKSLIDNRDKNKVEENMFELDNSLGLLQNDCSKTSEPSENANCHQINELSDYESSNDGENKSVISESSKHSDSESSDMDESSMNNSAENINDPPCDDVNKVTKVSSINENNRTSLLEKEEENRTTQRPVSSTHEPALQETGQTIESEKNNLSKELNQDKIINHNDEDQSSAELENTTVADIDNDNENVSDKINTMPVEISKNSVEEHEIQKNSNNEAEILQNSHSYVNETEVDQINEKDNANNLECNSQTEEESSITQENNVEDLEMGVFEESDEERTDNEDESESKRIEEKSKILDVIKLDTNTTNPLKRRLSTNTVQSNQDVPPAKKLVISHLNNQQEIVQNAIPSQFGTLPNGIIDDTESALDSGRSAQELMSLQKQPKISVKSTNTLLKNNASLVPNVDNVESCSTTPDMSIETIQRASSTKPSTRKVFLCAACHIYFEYWNLYLHMLEHHKRFICLYCLGMFGNSANLCEHLLKHHNLCTKHIAAGNSLGYKEYTNDNFILTCTTCGSIVQNNDLVNHQCTAFFEKDKSLNRSLDSSMESYPDPESFMLATMTEGSNDKTNKDYLEVITVEESSNKISPIKQSGKEVSTNVIQITPAKSGSSLDKLLKTINEVAENRTHESEKDDREVIQDDNLLKIKSPVETDVGDFRAKSPQSFLTTTPTEDVRVKSPHVESSTPTECTPISIETESSTPPNVKHIEEPSAITAEEKIKTSSIEENSLTTPNVDKIDASAALSELENCHKLLHEERTSGDETESDLDESLLNRSIGLCQSEPRINQSIDQTQEHEVGPVDSTKKGVSPISEESKADKSAFGKIMEKFFDAKVVLDPLEMTSDESSVDQTKKIEESPSIEEKSVINNTSLNASDKSEGFDGIDETKPHSSPYEKEFSNMGEDMENDDNREDFNDSDNENSLKIDDSVFEDDDDGHDHLSDAGKQEPKPVDEAQEEMSEVPIKINPLRIKIKMGPGNTGDTYERIKTETEIKEKEARERRYDEAIDEAIRKSVMYTEQKEACEAQREKDEYERLQQELAKKQEEYQRIQEHYQSLQANTTKESEQHEENDDEDEEEKESSTEHDESMEETRSTEKVHESVIEEPDDKENVEKMETESEDRVKLIERNNDEKASLLKEELLKKCEKLFAGVDQLPEEELETEPVIPLASEDIQPMALSLDERLENLNIRVVIKECVRTSCSICVYCYHATRIIVNGKQLALHILAEHRYTPVKNDTSEDLIQFIKNNINELENEFFSSETFDSTDKECFKAFDNVYYCLQCAFASKHQRELTSHKRKMHPKTSQICLLCKQILLNQSELLFHYCAGEINHNPQDNIYWCGICGLDKIPSTFRLMVHLRKKHNTCNVCLETCANEGKLLQHMLKHKIIHMCYKCNISYRNKQDITKHLFWKHGTESIVCKKCLQKRWSHVYHFCQPPARFTCDECNLMFKRSVSLKVHKRLHQGIYPYECTEEGCTEKFISRKLLEKHTQWHREPPKPPTPPPELKNESQSSEPHIDVCNVDDGQNPVQDLKTSSKKKKKKSKFDLNNMNLPPLNLSESESDSSDDDGPSSSPTSVKDTVISAEEPPTKLPETPTESVALEEDTEGADSKDVPPPLPEDKPASESASVAAIDEPKTEVVNDTDKPQLNAPIDPLPAVNVPDLTVELTKPSTADPSGSVSTKEPSIPPVEAEPMKTSLPPLEDEPLKTSLPPVEDEPLKTSVPPEEPLKASLPPVEEPLLVPDIVPDVWDQFKSFTQSLNVYRHVEEEHDYHIVYERPEEEEKPQEPASIPNTNEGHHGGLCEDETGVEKAAVEEYGEQDNIHDKSVDTTLNKTTSDDNDSSSDSSSSSSCGSQCGSNCSCSSSSSSSSSSSDDSSSDSDSSDPENRKRQEEKRAAKKARKKVKKHASHNTSDEVNVTIENSPPRETGGTPEGDVEVEDSHHEVIPPPLPPPINESDLDTEVSSSDEDFYDEKPQLSAPPMAAASKTDENPPQPQSPSYATQPLHNTTLPVPPVPSPPADIHYPQPLSHPVIPTTPARTPSRTPKKRKRPRMRNVPTSTPKASAPVFKTSFKHPFMRPSPAFETRKPVQPLMISTPTPAPDTLTDDSTRSSKRKRKQNRFYGYSDDEDDNVDYDNDESEEFSLVKHPPLKKKLFWKPPTNTPPFNDKIPALPPASPPLPYENKIRFENPFRKASMDYEAPSVDYGSAPSASSPAPSSSSSDSDDPVAPPPNYSPPPVTAPVPLYCYCRCPYDEVSEMIACDGDDCEIEWYHFECVNILVPPKGKWYCPQCRPKYQPF